MYWFSLNKRISYKTCLVCRLLEVLLQHCPGLAQAHLLLAESHYLAGNSPVALRKVADVVHRAPDNIAAHVLLTRIYLHQVCRFPCCASCCVVH